MHFVASDLPWPFPLSRFETWLVTIVFVCASIMLYAWRRLQ